jgi:hypothetical protein
LDQRVLSSIGFEKFRFLSYNMMIFIIFWMIELILLLLQIQ